MTISQVGDLFGLTADTLRYYERIGLIPPVHRNASGIRDYTERDINWVKFIKCMRSAGLSVEALIEYVSLFQRGDNTIGARKELLLSQRRQLNQKISEMQAVLAQLDKKIAGYEDRVRKCESQLISSQE